MILFPFLATVVDTAAGVSPLQQLAGQFGVNGPSLCAQILNFGLLAFILYRFAFKPVLSTLDERQKKIAQGLEYADLMKIQLEEAQVAYEKTLKEAAIKAQAMMEEASAASEAHSERRIQETAQQIEEMLHRAHEATELERKKMLQEVRAEIASLVIKTTAAVLDRDLSVAERSTFTQTALNTLAS